VKIDTTITQWDISAPAYSSSWGDVLGFNQQLDIFSGTSTTLQEWSDRNDLTAWPQD